MVEQGGRRVPVRYGYVDVSREAQRHMTDRHMQDRGVAVGQAPSMTND